MTVTGYKLDEFHYLDKSKIWAIAFSATQELDRQIISLKAENETLKTQIASLSSTAGKITYNSSTAVNGQIVEYGTNNNLVPVNVANYKGFYGVCSGNDTLYTKQCKILVINKAGNILSKGDLITSYLGGYGQKQLDETIKTSSVAKCCESIDFSAVTTTVELDGILYKYKLVNAVLV